jgi:F-type H+-transporting ATPase subunit b
MKKKLFFVFLILFATSALAYASGGGEAGGHDSSKLIDFGWRFLNFAVLVFVLYKLGAKAIRGFFVGNREAVKVSLEEAEAAKKAAQKKLEECIARVEKASQEIGEMADLIRAQGIREKEKIIEDAKRNAEKMKEDAKARIEQEFNKAVNQLRVEAADISVGMAEDILAKSVKNEDHEVMVENFLNRMVSKN